MSVDSIGCVVATVTDSSPEILAEVGLPNRTTSDAFEFSSSDLLVVSALSDGVSITDLNDPTESYTIAQAFDTHASLERLRFSPGGNHLLATNAKGDLRV